MKSSFVATLLILSAMNIEAQAEDLIQYRADSHSRASDFSREFFGVSPGYGRANRVDMGNVSLDVATELDCGNLDVKANLKGEFNKIQEQVKKIIPTPNEVPGFISKVALLATCYAYPTVCAQLRHDFLSLKANLNLRAQACQAIDKFIDSQADKGAKQLRAEAQANCVTEKINQGMDTASATSDCQSTSGLAIRDFQSGLEKKFTKNKQKVLASIVGFAHVSNAQMYDFLTSFLGEIEVQADGYWQPLFAKGMLRPNEVAHEFLVEGEDRVCKELSDIVENRKSPQNSIFEKSVVDVIKRRITKDDVLNINDLNDGDKTLACSALGRAIGQIAAQKSAAEGEATISSGLLNTAIPNSLRDEYRTRSSAAFLALKKTIESDQIPPLEEVRNAIANLAYATREKNRIIAAQITEHKLQNYRQESLIKSDCVDTLSCGEGF